MYVCKVVTELNKLVLKCVVIELNELFVCKAVTELKKNVSLLLNSHI
jgi:hypothetical protein